MNNVNTRQIKCHECELVVALPELPDGTKALCPRCRFALSEHRAEAEHKVLAFAISAFIFLALSIPFNFMSFQASGLQQTIMLSGVFEILSDNDYLPLAIVTAVAILALPGLIVFSLLYLLVPLQFGWRPYKSKLVLDLIYLLLPWSMAEIFLISVLVSLVKIKSMAEIGLGLSFYAYVLFTLSMAAMLMYMDKVRMYQLIGVSHCHPDPSSKVIKSPANVSIQRTWALLVTSVILYIPANFLPIMYTRVLGQDEPNTILGGVIVLWEMGSYPVALVILLASVVVPIAKIVILSWLNYSVQAGHLHNQPQRTWYYRMTEFVGRWSMVDVFVVAILVALIQLGNTMAIYPGPAAMAFCGVVVITMLAAMTFDSRLIWQEGSK